MHILFFFQELVVLAGLKAELPTHLTRAQYSGLTGKE